MFFLIWKSHASYYQQTAWTGDERFSKTNEFFSYDEATGHFIDSNSQKCMTTDCPAGLAVCIKSCDGSAAAPMQWTKGKDGTIRPRSAPASCLQVETKALDAPLSIGACTSPPAAA